MIFFSYRIKCSVHRKKKIPKQQQPKPANRMFLFAYSKQFTSFWHLALYSFAIANPRCPVSTRLNETCFPKDLCSLFCNSTFFLIANGQISPHCLLHYHLEGETVLWLVWDCTHFVWPLSHCQTECITAMLCLSSPQNWHQSGCLSSTQTQIFIKHDIHWEFHLSDLTERENVQNLVQKWVRERKKRNRQILVEDSPP